MDIEKWYNNTLAKPSAKVIRQMIIDFRGEFDGITYDAVARHLGESLTIEEILNENLEEIVYIRKKDVRNVTTNEEKEINRKPSEAKTHKETSENNVDDDMINDEAMDVADEEKRKALGTINETEYDKVTDVTAENEYNETNPETNGKNEMV